MDPQGQNIPVTLKQKEDAEGARLEAEGKEGFEETFRVSPLF